MPTYPVLLLTMHSPRVLGAPWDSCSQVVEECGITYSMLSTPEAASDVFFDPEGGVLAGLSAGKNLVDCATLQVEVRADFFPSPELDPPSSPLWRHGPPS